MVSGLVPKDCKSIDFSKEVSVLLEQVVILVRRSDIKKTKNMILIRRCDSDVAKP